MSDPVVVIGAGPVGLAAAANLAQRGIDVVVLEKGEVAAAAVGEWAHVRLFSSWSELVDPAAERLLEPTGWQRPNAATYPTGGEWRSGYLEPLAAQLGDRIRLGVEVTGVARRGRDRVVDAGRDEQPFVVHTRDASGREETLIARAVVDASGTWGRPNPAGADGYLAAGEKAAGGHIAYQMPDLANPQVRERYAGKHAAVVGSGHSALTALVALAELARSEPGTRVTWVLRRGAIGDTFGGGQADQLPARGALGLRAKAAVESGHIEVVMGFRTQAVDHTNGLALVGDDGQRVGDLDRVLVLTGFRPDLSILSEVRLDLDERLDAPAKLAPLIDPNVHSCGTVPPHGVNELAQPEADLFVVGMKSYGRAPTFLALTGYEQVRSIVAAIAGDWEAADRVELTLPDSGVCGGSGVYDDDGADAGCCAPAPQLLQIDALTTSSMTIS